MDKAVAAELALEPKNSGAPAPVRRPAGALGGIHRATAGRGAGHRPPLPGFRHLGTGFYVGASLLGLMVGVGAARDALRPDEGQE
jgi:hypothetical protein